MKRSIAVLASSRRQGNTGKLIDWIADELQMEVVDLGSKDISPFDYEHKNIGDDFLPTLKHILEFDKLIFTSPVYWYSMSAQMKRFVDRFSDVLAIEELKDTGRQFRGKAGHIVSISASAKADDSFLNSFKSTFTYLGLNIGSSIHNKCAGGFREEEYQEDVAKFVRELRNPIF